ncbi:integrase [Aeromicrobium panaciterrae]|uniref:Integrase n=1 Tax=Aeromicrobium panaciterrae TaxID=363861 RepID=A0ABU1UNS4_9ACTN|nr:tyrosine-type recombinase/integrase [Aeromicrobium panaciterrae]MDR7086821.1 integrase [Aeromicrobium panaciterrae]
MKARSEPNPHNAVFATGSGTWVSPNNVRRTWRKIREGTVFGEVTPHDFRRTVATLIAREHGSEGSAEQLGHTSDKVTKDHYIQRPPAPDFRETLEQFRSDDAP